MISFSRRVASVLLASSMIVSLGAETALAQGATVGPAGGVPSTTAPSNSQGTPAGGTGVVGSSAVPGTAATTTPGATTAPAATQTRRQKRRAHRAHRRSTRQLGTQSESGLNGSESTPPR